MKVNQVDEEILAYTTDEACWMPTNGRSKARCINANIACQHHFAALLKRRGRRLRLRKDKIELVVIDVSSNSDNEKQNGDNKTRCLLMLLMMKENFPAAFHFHRFRWHFHFKVSFAAGGKKFFRLHSFIPSSILFAFTS